MSVSTVADALGQARVLGIDRLDAQLMLCRVLGRPRTWVLAHDDAALEEDSAVAWQLLARRRAAGVPLAYLLGEKEFHGLRLEVTADVLVPRPETEVLVDRALDVLRTEALREPPEPAVRVLDLGTGSGAIALAVKSACPAAIVHASDLGVAALDVARRNAAALGLDVEFRTGSWWSPWDGERFDLVLANPPYIAESDPHLDALRHEPAAALVSGADGLSALRTIVAGAAGHLRRPGWLLLEHGFDQAEAVRAMLQEAGFGQIDTTPDLAGRARCTGGRLQGEATPRRHAPAAGPGASGA